jgi:putative ABC transport system substrate-binding protein
MFVKRKGLFKFFALSLLVVFSFSLAGCGEKQPPASSNQDSELIKIGIVQIAEHPALDGAREGFIEALKEKGFVDGEKIKIDYQNAQGDMSVAKTIADKFVTDKVDLVLAVATQAAQAMANASSDIPILVTAITDPVDAGLVDSLEEPGRNVTGTSDLTPVKSQLELLKQLVPDVKNVGVLYNAGEANSVIQVDIAKQAAQELGLTIVEGTVANVSEVNQVAQSVAKKVDALYVPTDNTVASAIQAVVQVAEEQKLPLICGEEAHVDNGGLATRGINYFELGKQTGEMAVEVLNGKKPAELAVQFQSNTELVINLKAAERIGLTIPQEILDKADRTVEK